VAVVSEYDEKTMADLLGMLDDLHVRFIDGGAEKKLEYATHAISWARAWELPIPGWVIEYIWEALDKRAALEAPSLDAAFGLVPYTPAKKLKALRQRTIRRVHAEAKAMGKELDWEGWAEELFSTVDTLQKDVYSNPGKPAKH
jgi:hypothetical protein